MSDQDFFKNWESDMIGVCPDRRILEQFLDGHIASGEIEGLAQHLEQCDRCVEALHDLKSEDMLVESMRFGLVTTEYAEGDVFEGLVARLKRLNASATEVSPETMDPLDILRPAQAADEIGRLGPYRILRILGNGGMGVVFKAEDPKLQRLVALKVMRPALAANKTAQQRFLREGRATAALSHDNIVTIYQVGEDRGVPYLAMEFLQGEPLDQWLDRGQKAKTVPIVHIAREIAKGLAAAHERGLVHRDIKPGNIWLEPRPLGSCRWGAPAFRVKILDFGLARGTVAEDRLTLSGDVVGTPAYMAPEQARGEPVDARSDLFSLGCILYRLCTGQHPFQGATSMDLMTAQALHHIRPVRELNPDLPPALGDLVMGLLAQDPAARPASAKAVSGALLATLRDLKLHRRGDTATGKPETREAEPQRQPAAAVRESEATTENIATSKEKRAPDPFPTAQPLGKHTSRRYRLVTVTCLAVLALGVLGLIFFLLPRSSSLIGESPLDKLDPDRIPLEDRFDGQPRELVAVLGSRCLPRQTAAVAFAADGKTLALAGGDHTIQLWDTATPKGLAVLGEPQSVVLSFAFADEGRTLVSGNQDNTIRIWDVETGKEIGKLLGHTQPVTSVALATDGSTILSGSADETVKLWDRSTGQARSTFKGHTGKVLAVALSPDGRTAASGSSDRTVKLWDVGTGKERTLAGHEEAVTSLAYAPDGRLLISGSGDRTVKVWDPLSGKERKSFQSHGGAVASVALASDGKVLAASGADGQIIAWDLASGEIICKWRLPGPVHGVAFAPDNRHLATANGNGTVYILRLAR